MLEQDLNVLLASMFGMAVKAQRYHWNVMSSDFHQLHDFYEEIYDDLYEHIDILAEIIRARDDFPIGTLTELAEVSQVAEEEETYTSPMYQLPELERANAVLIRIIKIALTASKDEEEPDVEDFLINRLRAHKKHGWMIRATLEE